jgi:hypothetical protein
MAIKSVKNKTRSGSLLIGNAPFIPTDFESIATATGTGSSDTITFSSIPSTYKHLQIRGIANDGVGNGFEASIRFNGDSAANYAYHRALGNGSSVTALGSGGQDTMRIGNASNVADNVAVYIVDIHDYASTTKNKTIRSLSGRDTNGAGFAILYSGLWLSTSAVNSVSVVNVGARSWSTTTTFALYGIKG